MYWVNFLHIYQPTTQSKEILKKVVNESYRPLFFGLLKIPKIKINLNITAVLTELFIKEGYEDVVDAIRKLAETKRLEFTESAKYHPLLPFLKEDEIIRQVIKNNKDNKKYFGEVYKPVCFFPPEMAYSPKVGKVISELGYQMIIIDDIAYNGGKDCSPKEKLFTIKGTDNLIAVFRERRVSNCIMSAVVRNKKDFADLIKEDLKENKYLCTAMDGETFGHHRPGLEKFLFKILESKNPKQLFFSELPNYFPLDKKITPKKSTWASAQEDIEEGIQFYSWKDPKNKVHQLQWRFLNYLLKVAKTKKLSSKVQDRLDRTMASDQFFWASGEPWWSIEMIEKGAIEILETLKLLPSITKAQIQKGKIYYGQILATTFRFQRSGRIEAMAKKYKEAIRIPFKERTLPEYYYAFLQILKKEMEKAAKERSFEKAIMWRNAIWKLETKNDIYDTIHIIDLLRKQMAEPELEKLIKKYKEKYKRISPGQPELRRAIH